MIKALIARGITRKSAALLVGVGTTATVSTSALYGTGTTLFSTAAFGQASSPQSQSSKDHRFATYNLLSSHLAEPAYFVYCDKDDLDQTTRLTRIKAKVIEEMEKGSIIALQEVSHTWAGPLHALFANHGFHFATGLYGKKFNNYMGVGIAWSADRYEAVDVDIKRVSDKVKWPRQPRPDPLMEWLLSPWRYLFGKKAPFDPYKVAGSRANELVCVRLRDRATGQTFCVATYHMPCLFGTPLKRQTMVMHSSLVTQHLQEVSQGDPCVLLGDFNFQPGDSSYRLLTEGALPATDPDYPAPRPGVKLDVNNLTAMRSAYHAVNGTEPPFTNHARIKNQSMFTETLDYIFMSPEWSINAVDATPTRDSTRGPYPNAEEPSDHIKIGASASLPAN